MASILSQHCEERLVFQFRVDNLRAMFNLIDADSGVDQYDTAVFGPGFFFRISAYQSDDHGPCFNLGLCASDDLLQPVHVEVTVDGRSRDNETAWFSYQDARDVRAAGDVLVWDNVLSASFLDDCVNLRRDNALVVMAVLKLTRLTPPPARLSPDALDLLYQSLESKEPPTVRWVAFSARRPDGTLTRPQSVFAPRDILVSSCEEIEHSWEEGLALLDGALCDSESLPPGLDGNAIDDLAAFSDYESDYDDDDINVEEDLSGTKPLRGVHSLPDMIDSEADITEEPLVLVDGEANATTASEGSSTGFSSLSLGDDTKLEDILLRGVAHRTWQALIYYLYTGIVVFAPLSSNGKEARDSFLADYKKSYPNRPTPSSCKALYDVAVKLGLNDLQKRAFSFLRRQLNEKNIIDELFSPLTSRHEPVRTMEVTFLVQNWDTLTRDSALEEKIDEMARGERPYATALVMHIFRAVAATECRTTPEAEDPKQWWDGVRDDRSDSSDETYSYYSSDCDKTTDDDMDYEAETAEVEREAKLEAAEEAEARAREAEAEARAREEEARAQEAEVEARAKKEEARRKAAAAEAEAGARAAEADRRAREEQVRREEAAAESAARAREEQMRREVAVAQTESEERARREAAAAEARARLREGSGFALFPRTQDALKELAVRLDVPVEDRWKMEEAEEGPKSINPFRSATETSPKKSNNARRGGVRSGRDRAEAST
ncbi:uncharacterized protein B0H18DRAFT_953118 [Fomitopsis serialis]|uniref:uncharacterized protein n=1 Tax=Fomitopsis serialis TaxID=139415 RepID=UPI002007D26E|nr:uncharacterized protein B0H18DRAFT_953118 [Neoantrodia serialis]KAH9930743.1 hypothetical protein B0H18DRAFT_953118 [Neoantrodia serialis]